MYRGTFALFLFLVGMLAPAFADRIPPASRDELLSHYEYDAHNTLIVEETPRMQVGNGVLVYEVEYDSPKGGVVPAYLVVPNGDGPFAGVVWGHWADFKTSSRDEFLDEAIVLAQSGVESLLIDAPFARPGFVPDKEPIGPQYPKVQQQMVVDVRRGVDYLLSRGEVDPTRLAYVGHSFDAGIGGIVAGVEHRLKGVVIMAGRLNDRDYLDSDEPNVIAARQRLGEERISKLIDEYYWTNPFYFLREPGESKLLLQYGEHDWFVSPEVAQRYMRFIRHPAEIRLYDASHELNVPARLDRAEWLKKLLGLRPIDRAALEHLPIPN